MSGQTHACINTHHSIGYHEALTVNGPGVIDIEPTDDIAHHNNGGVAVGDSHVHDA